MTDVKAQLEQMVKDMNLNEPFDVLLFHEGQPTGYMFRIDEPRWDVVLEAEAILTKPDQWMKFEDPCTYDALAICDLDGTIQKYMPGVVHHIEAGEMMHLYILAVKLNDAW